MFKYSAVPTVAAVRTLVAAAASLPGAAVGVPDEDDQFGIAMEDGDSGVTMRIVAQPEDAGVEIIVEDDLRHGISSWRTFWRFWADVQDPLAEGYFADYRLWSSGEEC